MKKTNTLIFLFTISMLGLLTLLPSNTINKKKLIRQPANFRLLKKKDSTILKKKDSTYLKALLHLKEFEKFSSTVYIDVDGSRTIGYGHHLLKGEHFQNITEKEAHNILNKDLKLRLKYIKATYYISGDTLLALALFSFNCGVGTLGKAIKNGLLKQPQKLLKYCHYKTYDSNGNTIWHSSQQLLTRRKYELALINK
jgi:GH24 family phage-related lysozyme (muramidase)